jgi:hypothetical protein
LAHTIKERTVAACNKESLLLVLLLALGLAAMPEVAGAGPSAAFVERVSHHPAGTHEAAAIIRWLDGLPDADRRVMEPGTLTVRQRRVGNGALARAAAMPPVPLPASGAPGERITITNQLPGGFIETWTFQWVSGSGGGGWKQTDYEMHAPVVEPERPQEL